MGQKAKSVYLVVCPKGKLSAVFRKVFFDAKSYNEYVNTPEFMEKYPKTDFDIIKEIY